MSAEHKCGASQQGALQAAVLAQDYERFRSLSMTEQGAPLRQEEHAVPESQRTGDALTPELQQCCFSTPVLPSLPVQAYIFLQKESLRRSPCSAWTILPHSTQAAVCTVIHRISPKATQPPLCVLVALGSLHWWRGSALPKGRTSVGFQGHAGCFTGFLRTAQFQHLPGCQLGCSPDNPSALEGRAEMVKQVGLRGTRVVAAQLHW